MNDPLKTAMDRADQNDPERLGREAVRVAVAQLPPAPRPELPPMPRLEPPAYDPHPTLADAVEVVARQRARLGRKICSADDAAAIDAIVTLLRGLNKRDPEQGFHG